MGQDPDQIAFDLDRQRQSFKSRVNRLDRRVREDISITRDNARDRADHLQARVDGAVGSQSTLAEHPRALVGSSFGIGFLAGFLTGGEDRPQQDRHVHQFEAREDHRRDQRPDQPRSGLVRKSATMAYGPIGGALSQVVVDLQDDVAHFVRDLLRTGKDRLREQFSSGDGKSRGTWSVDHNDTRLPFEDERPTAEELLPRGPGDTARSPAPRAREHSKN